MKARIFSDALSFTFDKQGRFGVSADLLRHAGIAKDAVLSGMGDTFNILSPARWADQRLRMLQCASSADTR